MWTLWKKHKQEHQELCNTLLNGDGEMHEISARHLQMILRYYHDVLIQALASFVCAVLLAILGFSVLAYTIDFAMKNPDDSVDVGSIGLISGALVEFLSGVAFFIYKRATEQFNTFHICLERTNRYLMAFNINEMIDSKDLNRDRARHELACIIATAPMITQKDIRTPPKIRSTPPKDEALPATRRQPVPSNDHVLQPQPNHA